MIKHDHTRDELFMRRALQLAEYGRGSVSPNPLVGSVIVHNDLIIGEGWHREFGGPHAEVNAVNSVTEPALIRESTVYVNLEPCSHFGKTPPCADLLIKLQAKKVVIANLDSNPKVAGGGIKKLRDAGIEVITGIMESAGHDLNKRFFTFMIKNAPTSF
jgi:diaminohydroxyphosphoribosylaminopyrimidine deaminase / 5-amino-6-(5-phosphoribosylamino)uracil reductase